jgi:hypothetical protein
MLLVLDSRPLLLTCVRGVSSYVWMCVFVTVKK